LLAANGIMKYVLGKRHTKVTIYSKHAVSSLYQIWVRWNKGTDEDRVELRKPEALSQITSEM
jgi:hypothetical protein